MTKLRFLGSCLSPKVISCFSYSLLIKRYIITVFMAGKVPTFPRNSSTVPAGVIVLVAHHMRVRHLSQRAELVLYPTKVVK